MHIKNDLMKILEKVDKQHSEELCEIMEEMMCHMKECDYETYHKYKLKIYEMANGKVLTKEMAENWVRSMMPYHEHWTIEQATEAMKQYGYSYSQVDWYATLNMMYNDYCDTVGENTEMYIKLANDWLNDEDAIKDKLYMYWKKIVKHDDK